VDGICDHQNRLALPTLDGALIYDGKEFIKIRGLPRYDAVLDIYEDRITNSCFLSAMGPFIRTPDGSMKDYQIKPENLPLCIFLIPAGSFFRYSIYPVS
jgi:hypothetical protein